MAISSRSPTFQQHPAFDSVHGEERQRWIGWRHAQETTKPPRAPGSSGARTHREAKAPAYFCDAGDQPLSVPPLEPNEERRVIQARSRGRATVGHAIVQELVTASFGRLRARLPGHGTRTARTQVVDDRDVVHVIRVVGAAVVENGHAVLY